MDRKTCQRCMSVDNVEVYNYVFIDKGYYQAYRFFYRCLKCGKKFKRDFDCTRTRHDYFA